MSFFKIQNSNLEPIKKVNFKYEKDLQKLTEKNLEKIFNLQFVETEFAVDNLRIDTLAYNKETKSFVIIEYKRDKKYSVIDQGFSYLSILLNNKADFVLKYNENLNANLKKADVDWSQTLVIFIAPSFTTYQLKSIEFNNLTFELWEVSKFNNGTISFDKVNVSKNKESINTLNPKNTKVTKVIKKYKESRHLRNKSKKVKEIYNKIKEDIFEYTDVEIVILKHYLAIKINKKNICEIVLYKNHIIVWIDLEFDNIKDSLNKVKDFSNVGHLGTGNCKIQINEIDEVPYFMELFKQSYDEKLYYI